ncbi:Fe-S cluster assembly protein SufD [Vibrio tapetis subsp. quintayensis]|uniref:Fe-S cluster assembly protein SufD n=1 Tax=Vibrio tapetis TaxID=52443 RepID=UPI0025B5DD38|nr:Fe-S cluster assembly protein SufD [Vibrio tapetis]MDN3679684.1 Fe-S cluster assembly protein SufD [Vibrio tapetis subsp. quintayensis]
MVGLSEKNRDVALTRLSGLVGQSSWQQSHWQSLLKLGLPDERHEDWKYTSLADFVQLPYCKPSHGNVHGISFESLSMVFDCYRLVFFDGEFQHDLSDEIPNVDYELMTAETFDYGAAIAPDMVSLLAEASATTGVHVRVRNNTQVKKPIYLFHLNSGGLGEWCSYRHHIELGQGAQCEVYEHHTSLALGGGVTCSRLSCEVGNGANYRHFKLVEESQQQHHFAHNDVMAQRDSQVRSDVFMLEGQLTRHSTSATLQGAGGYAQLNSLALPKQEQVFDTRTYIQHASPHCDSDQTHKIIGKDNGIGVFNGSILVDKHAIKTNGQMDNHNLLLSDLAQVNSKPQLEIYADDVKCSHGATTGQIDPSQVFYLRARGIPLAQAEKMITFAFAGELTDAIENDDVRQHIIRRIEQKLDMA